MHITYFLHRSGLQLDVEDERTKSFSHLLELLPSVKFQYILLENVKGFEISAARNLLLKTLIKCEFRFQEFLLTPTSVGIPNSRLRYYLIGKKNDMEWSFKTTLSVMTEIPLWGQVLEKTPYEHVVQVETDLWKSRRKNLCGSLANALPSSWCVGDIVETSEETLKYAVPAKVVKKYGEAMDIVSVKSKSSCCFTKSYGKYVKGTGSVFDKRSLTLSLSTDANEAIVDRDVRYFSPREVARLMCYPESYNFPSHLTPQQKYKALGNSVNVYVISILLSLLLPQSSA